MGLVLFRDVEFAKRLVLVRIFAFDADANILVKMRGTTQISGRAMQCAFTIIKVTYATELAGLLVASI